MLHSVISLLPSKSMLTLRVGMFLNVSIIGGVTTPKNQAKHKPIVNTYFMHSIVVSLYRI